MQRVGIYLDYLIL